MARSGKLGYWFVAEKKVDENLSCCTGSDHPMLYKDVIEAKSLHWIPERPHGLGAI